MVAAGNTPAGANYDSLNLLAKCSGVVSGGNMADPYEGGWYLNASSNRGTGTLGPSLTAPGISIRADFVSWDMASPMVAGIAALLDASNGSLSYNFISKDFGQAGYDKVYGNDLILGLTA